MTTHDDQLLKFFITFLVLHVSQEHKKMFLSLMFQRWTVAEIAQVSEINKESVLALDYFLFLVVLF